MQVCAVLLAAGSSSRYGGVKLLAPVDGVPLVRRAAFAALDAGLALVVVTGAHVEAVDAALHGIAATRLHNADWADGMGSSIAAAFSHLLRTPEPYDAAIVYPADLPLIGHVQLARLIERHWLAPSRIQAADIGGVLAPPCLFPRDCFAELARLSGPRGARIVLEGHADRVDAVAMPEAAVDIDTCDDYRRFVAQPRQPPPPEVPEGNDGDR